MSAILQFPPQVVKEQVTLTYRKVNFKECEVKPKDGELLVSGIFKIEPEGVTFKKPVTVFLSHSVYEDQVFMDFYELIVENLSLTGWEDLKTEQISSSKGMDSNICMFRIEYGDLKYRKSVLENEIPAESFNIRDILF